MKMDWIFKSQNRTPTLIGRILVGTPRLLA